MHLRLWRLVCALNIWFHSSCIQWISDFVSNTKTFLFGRGKYNEGKEETNRSNEMERNTINWTYLLRLSFSLSHMDTMHTYTAHAYSSCNPRWHWITWLVRICVWCIMSFLLFFVHISLHDRNWIEWKATNTCACHETPRLNFVDVCVCARVCACVVWASTDRLSAVVCCSWSLILYFMGCARTYRLGIARVRGVHTHHVVCMIRKTWEPVSTCLDAISFHWIRWLIGSMRASSTIGQSMLIWEREKTALIHKDIHTHTRFCIETGEMNSIGTQ